MTNATLRKIAKNAQQEYLYASAEHEVTMRLVNDIKKEELNAHAYMDEETGERIFNPDFAFGMNDADFRTYLQSLYPKYLAAGFAIESYEYAPQYRSEMALRNAERAVLDAIYATAPREVRSQIAPLRKHEHRADVRKKMIDLFMQLDPSTIVHGD